MSEIQRIRDDVLALDRQVRRLRAQQQQRGAGDFGRANAIVGVIPSANIPAHGSIGLWTNQSGGALGIGAVVIQNGDRQFDTTATADDLDVVGVLTEAIANTAEGRLRHQGYHPSVIVEGAVVAGQFLRTSTTAGAAEDAGTTPTAGTFGMALTAFAGPGAGTVTAYLFGTIGGVSDHGVLTGLTDPDHISIGDADGDTYHTVEESADEDIHRFYVAGTEHFRIGGDSQLDFFNGSILETTRIVVSSDGAAVTLALDQAGGGDLTLILSDGFSTFDTTPAATIALTAGSDTSPQTNYVYILQSTKALTVSTVGWPSEEHAPIAIIILQSAATTQTENALVVHLWHDHVQGSDEQGHYSHIGRWIRQHSATYESGVAQTLTITTNAGVPDNVDFATTAGEVYQMHLHAVPAFDTATGTNVHVVNDSVAPYTTITDLADLLTDSAGGSMSGKYFNLVIWASVSEEMDETHLFVNLPSGSYNKQGDATDDVSGFTDFTIPDDFKGTAFLISRLTLRHQAASGGTWTSIQETDLRGLIPNLVAGGGTSAITTEFADNAFRIFDESDVTKLLAFQLSGITPGNTRTLAVPDGDGTLLLAGGLSGGQTLIGGTASGENLTLQSTAHATRGSIFLDTVTVKDGSIELHHGTDTISGDEITTPTGGYIIVAAQAGVTDDLDGIGGGAYGRLIVVRADAGDTITVRHNDAGGGAGRKILLSNDADLVLVGNDDGNVTLLYDESLDSGNGAWFEITRGGGAVCDLSAYTITNVTTDRTYDADATSIDELADVLGTLIDDLDGCLGGGVSPDASAVTYTPAVLADWDGDADPGNVDDALDELAERTTDVEERGVFEANSSTSFLWGTSGVWLDQTPFIGTINGAPTATTIVYNHTSGELSISPGQVIHNTTLGERACITAINTGTNTITVEANSPDDVSGWSNTDAITTASQTNTGRGGIFVDIDANRVLGGASVVALNLSLSGLLRNADLHFVITHPYESYDVSKENTIMYLQDALNQYKQWVQPVEVVNSRHYFTMCFLLLAADNNTGQCRFQGQFTKLVA